MASFSGSFFATSLSPDAAAPLRCVGRRPSAAPAVRKRPDAVANPSSRHFRSTSSLHSSLQGGLGSLRCVCVRGAPLVRFAFLIEGAPPPPALRSNFLGLFARESMGETNAMEGSSFPPVRPLLQWVLLRRSAPPGAFTPFAPLLRTTLSLRSSLQLMAPLRPSQAASGIAEMVLRWS